MTSLDEICLKHGADKGTLDRHGNLGHGYASVYEPHFAPLRGKPIRILEVGVWRGASIRAWLDYFPLCTVVGVDIEFRSQNLNDLRAEQRVTLIEADSRKAKLDGPFHIIIDDGDHTPQVQWDTYRKLRPLLAPEGTYWIEELARSTWVEFKNESSAPGFKDTLFSLLRASRKVYDCRARVGRDSVLALMQ